MKKINSYLILGLLMSLIIGSSYKLTSIEKSENILEASINSFLSGEEKIAKVNIAEIYSDFIVKENGHFYSIDFMLTSDGEVIILSKDIEEEYYILDKYTTKNLKHHTTVIALPNSGLGYKA